uniref:NACHT LRR and PYD domain-containing protein n=1 Tax=Nothobranchius furzeri TaxID=105023 RepID=A0A8C6KG55_NOTFU
GGLYQDRVFCFVHLSVQEFLAALHSYLTFSNYGDKETVFYKSAVDKALESSNGHLDLFLRFLLGLSLQTNRTLLRGMLTQRGSSSQTNQETIQYIKEKISKNMSVEKNINLFYCLNELNDDSLVMEIQKLQRSGYFSIEKLSAAHLSALIFLLLSSEKDLDLFDLKKFSASETVLLKLLPVVKASNKAILSDCILNKESCEALSSVLSSQSSRLRELDLRIHDSGVKPLSDGLLNPKCKLKIIRSVFSDIIFLLFSHPSDVKELDMSKNKMDDSGVKLLNALKSPNCPLETLRLCNCGLSVSHCGVVASFLQSTPSHLKHLDLSENQLKDSGVKILSSGFISKPVFYPLFRLENCGLSPISLSYLGSALKSNPSHLTEMNLSQNKNLHDSGVKQLCGFLESPHCRLEALSLISLKTVLTYFKVFQSLGSKVWFSFQTQMSLFSLRDCGLSRISCSSLVSVLKFNPSRLTELDLSWNNLKDVDVQQLLDLVESRNYRLSTLRLVKSWSGKNEKCKKDKIK